MQNNLKLHLDGARLWNALIAKGETPKQYGEIFDSISICLSKGLGTPVGSLLLGNKTYIQKARRIRKVFGGGMRQAGYLAAAGIFALENNISRLQYDHDNAKKIASALSAKSFVGEILPVETNIVIFKVLSPYTPESFSALMEEHSISVMAISATQVRMVTHLDVSNEQVDKLVSLLNSL